MPAKKTAKKKTVKATSYKDWDQCPKCKRHIANMTRHNAQHKSGEIDDKGLRTDKGRKVKAAAKGKAKAKPKAKKAKAKKAPAESTPAI